MSWTPPPVWPFWRMRKSPSYRIKKKEGMSLPLSNYRNNDCGIPKRDKRQREEIADKRYAMLKSLGAEFLWEIDESILITAGRFKGQYRLSLADAIIAAFAKKEGAVLVHKDPEFDLLKKEVSQLALPKK